MINFAQKEYLNKTIVLGEKVRISDPCYDVDTWCAGTLENVLAGTYKCFEQRADCDGWGNRIASIEVRHSDYPDVEPTELQNIDVGVDSGQCGIYDLDYFTKAREDKHGEDAWYWSVCNKTGGYVLNPNYIPFEKSEWWDNEFEKIHRKNERINNESIINLEKKLSEINFEFRKEEDDLEELSLKVKYWTQKAKYSENWKISQEEIYKNMANTLDNKCLVSSSGYGDGSYHCLVGRNDAGQIVSIKVDYFYYEDEDDEE